MRRSVRGGLFAVAVAVLSAVPTTVHAQSVQGRITEEGVGRSLPGVDIRLLDAARELVVRAASDELGMYLIEAPEAGNYYVVVDLIGYRRLETPLVALQAGVAMNVSFEMPSDAIELEGLRVEADRLEEIKRDVAMFGVRVDDLGERFVDAETIAKRPMASDFGLVLQWQSIPAMRVVRGHDQFNPGKPDVCVMLSQARDRCALTILNGALVTRETAASIPPEALEAIVVLDEYESSTLYGTDGGGGAILLFTAAGRR